MRETIAVHWGSVTGKGLPPPGIRMTAGPVIEYDDSPADHYSVEFDGHRYVVYGPGVAVEDAWGLVRQRHLA